MLVPALVATERLARRRGVRPAWLPLLAWGAAQYHLTGRYRLRHGGGPPGMSQGYPERLVTSGPYAWSRNPMYLGHLVFLAGLVPASRSPVAVAAFAAAVPWFRARVRRDEERLTRLFGEEYRAYLARVPRWIGSAGSGRLDAVGR